MVLAAALGMPLGSVRVGEETVEVPPDFVIQQAAVEEGADAEEEAEEEDDGDTFFFTVSGELGVGALVAIIIGAASAVCARAPC